MTHDTTAWHPLTGAQRSIWLDAALQPGAGAYRVTTLFSVPARLDPDHARAATAALAEAHEVMALVIDAEQPRQRRAEPQIGFAVAELTDEARAAHLAERAGRGFALGGVEPLCRVELLLSEAASHVLIEAHHLIADGLSAGRLRHDWIAAYNALASGKPPALAASSFLPSLAADPASDKAGASEDYWCKRLADPPPPLLDGLLADDAAAPDTETAPPDFRLDAARYARLAETARAAGTTAHRALSVIAGMMLARRLGREDVMIGMALHGRDTATMATVGQFARLLPLRFACPAEASLLDTLRSNAALIDADLAHQAMPLDSIARACGVGSERRHLVEVAISIMLFTPGGEPELAAMPITLRRAPGTEHSPLSFYAREEGDGGLSLSIGHDPACVSTAEAARIAERFAALIDRCIERPQAKLGAFSRLAKGEEARLAEFGQGPRVPLDNALPLSSIHAHGQAAPEALAVIDGPRQLTYAALEAEAAALAGALAAAGVAKGDRVAVICERSADTIIALLAILRLGAVYLPIDPGQPEDRAVGMLEGAGVRLVIARADWADKLAGRFACLPADARAAAASPVEVAPADPAYIIYTSGSTGAPKGVVVPHRALANLDVARQLHDPIGPGDRILAGISVGFDVSLGQLLLPLLRGASIVIAPDLRLLSPAQFWDFCARHGVTHINSVPSFFEAMLEAAPPTARLTRLMLGGEPLTPLLARRLRAALHGEVVNMYGPTEACIDASAYVVPADLPERTTVLPIGRPLPNYIFHILDARRMPVGIGQSGELCIGGPGLALGYLNAPDLTAERFIDTDYGRLYRTGDVAAWREDGQVMFLGRADGQVKIRGHRIELGEIEAALLAHPQVAQAAVIARKDMRGAMRLLAYAVPRAGADLTGQVLGAHLSEHLPHYMVPSAVQVLPALPLTTNGKLDAKSLPEPNAQPSRAPAGDAEIALAGLFAEVLGVAEVGAEESFFELGGHSLLATQLAVRIREVLGASLPIRVIYEAPSVAALARRLADAPADDLPPLNPRKAGTAPLPLSFTQEQLWFLDRLQPGSVAYTIPLVFRLKGALDVVRLETALASLIARHEALRTGFVEAAGAPRQTIADTLPVPLCLHDMPGAGRAALHRAVAAEIMRPFDLTQPPLVRLALFRRGAKDHIAVLCLHHIVADGWSVAVLLDELAALYAGQALADLPLAPADVALWQRELFAGAEAERQRDWWLNDLKGAPDWLNLPPDADAAHDDGLAPLRLDGRAVAKLAAHTGASPFAVLMAAWGLLLGRWSGQRDLLVGTVLAGRQDPRLERLVGLFANTLPVRMPVMADADALIRATHERMLDIHAHQEMPLERLVEAMRPRRVPGRHPLFQALFVLQNGPVPQPAFPGLAVEALPVGSLPARFDLALSLAPDATGFAGDISFSGRLFHPATVKALGQRLAALIADMAAHPEMPVENLPALANWGSPWREAAPQASPPRALAEGDADPQALAMAALFAEVLGTGPVAPEDNFFTIGGHSLAALKLIARIEAERGQEVPVSLLFAHQTPASLAQALAEGATAPTGPLVTLQTGAQPPLVCVHAIGGSAMAYHPLAEALAPGQMVLGLEAALPGPDSPASVAALAASYVAALRAVQPQGPYHLLGHSFGGLIAFTMAQQLEAAGENVARLILLDTDTPSGEAATPAMVAPAPEFIATMPAARRGLLDYHLRLIADCKPQGKVRALAYMRADGDGRDAAREAYWLGMAQEATALEPMPCGHYAMLDHPGALAARILQGQISR